jgi:hypothetical protein
MYCQTALSAIVVSLLGCLVLPAMAADEVQDAQVLLQATTISQRKDAFSAPYSGQNSLGTAAERSRTTTATLYLGKRLWQGGEIYLNPEMALGVPLSGLRGLGGFNNAEIARTAGVRPSYYRARLFLRQTWGLGGGREALEQDQNQMAGAVDARRFVLTAGNVSVLDIFDDNSYAKEPRRQFMNWALITYGAFDFAADSRGYTWGVAGEYITPQWTLRGGRFLMPRESNGLQLNYSIANSYGDVGEFERKMSLFGGREGRVRLLAYRNVASMGNFSAALDQAAGSGRAPDLATVRQNRSKLGFGISVEHELTANAGAFVRASRHDGKSETYAFTEIDRSVSGGVVFKGGPWGREGDEIGLALVTNGLSSSHRQYLAAGGLGFFLGDGRLNYATEKIAEAYYSLKLGKKLWLSADYQRVANPGYNADRGPVNVWGLRAHVEF